MPKIKTLPTNTYPRIEWSASYKIRCEEDRLEEKEKQKEKRYELQQKVKSRTEPATDFYITDEMRLLTLERTKNEWIEIIKQNNRELALKKKELEVRKREAAVREREAAVRHEEVKLGIMKPRAERNKENQPGLSKDLSSM